MKTLQTQQLLLFVGMLSAYALIIGGITESIKRALTSDGKRPRWCNRALPLFPLLIGAVSGVAVVPLLLTWSGIIVPTTDEMTARMVAGFLGGGVGSFSAQVYQTWDKTRATERLLEAALDKATGEGGDDVDA